MKVKRIYEDRDIYPEELGDELVDDIICGIWKVIVDSFFYVGGIRINERVDLRYFFGDDGEYATAVFRIIGQAQNCSCSYNEMNGNMDVTCCVPAEILEFIGRLAFVPDDVIDKRFSKCTIRFRIVCETDDDGQIQILPPHPYEFRRKIRLSIVDCIKSLNESNQSGSFESMCFDDKLVRHDMICLVHRIAPFIGISAENDFTMYTKLICAYCIQELLTSDGHEHPLTELCAHIGEGDNFELFSEYKDELLNNENGMRDSIYSGVGRLLDEKLKDYIK